MDREAIGVLGLLGAGWAGCRGVRLVVQGLGRADDPRASLWLVRGLRGVAVGVGSGALGAGALLDQTWLLVFGLIFLGEELYETGVVALVLRAGARADRDAVTPPAGEGRGRPGDRRRTG